MSGGEIGSGSFGVDGIKSAVSGLANLSQKALEVVAEFEAFVKTIDAAVEKDRLEDIAAELERLRAAISGAGAGVGRAALASLDRLQQALDQARISGVGFSTSLTTLQNGIDRLRDELREQLPPVGA
ncbi:MAG: hypothetical protein PHH60_00530 [Candidatus Margulisbacteria bacterium]|nr:hypothetical protein [Candidatus Margulisiibacteriota bacterium]